MGATGVEPPFLGLESHQSVLNLAMTIGTDEDAFLGLFAKGVQGTSVPHVHPHPLLRRIDVMELKRAMAAVVSADCASPASLIDKRLLDLLLTFNDRFAHAILASKTVP
jgi:hypothetical protein